MINFAGMTKAELRKQFIKKRNALTSAELENLSESILEHLQSLTVFEDAEYVHMFHPISGKQEINTLRIAEWLRKDHPQIKLLLPKSNFEDHTLEHIVWDSDNILIINKWGISEPEAGHSIPAEKIDIVLVPLLAVDFAGHRIGYGKGFYDRFLAKCRPNVVKIGLSFFEPIEHIEDVNTYDIPLNKCVTPKQVWHF